MNTILYIRQSKDSKDAEGSLQGQEQECRTFALEHGLTITQVLRDTVTGQKRIARRAQGGLLLDGIEARECEAILLPSVDRLSRDTFASDDLRVMIDYLGDSGIKWYFADSEAPFDYTSEAQVIDVLAELTASAKERVNIEKRTMRKKRAMLQNGELVLTGAPPFGYTREWEGVGKNAVQAWVIEPSHALVIKRIFELYNSGSQVAQVVTTLIEENALTPSSAPWNRSAIYRILSNEIYKGMFVWGKHSHNKKHGTKVLREVGDPNRFDIPREDFRIVSDKVWERAQVLTAENKTVRTPKQWLLRGHLFCECGEKFIANGDRYRCNSSKQKGHSCGIGSLKKDVIENDVWSLVEHLTQNPTELFEKIWESMEQGSGAQIENALLAEDTRRARDAKSRELDNVAYSISKAEGARTIDSLLKRSSVLEQEYTILDNELTARSQVAQPVNVDPDKVSEQVFTALQNFENLDYNGKRTLLSTLNLRVVKLSKVTAEEKGTDYITVVSISGVS